MSVLLVLTTVHPPDDPRVRTRTVGVLARKFRVRYATQQPGPTVRLDHEWVALDGGRLSRNLAALRQAWRRDVRILSLHDPELLPLGLLVSVSRGIPVVFDLHENLPAQIRSKEWLPPLLRPLLAPMAAVLLKVAERRLTITLAEPGYRELFVRLHPVLPNYPLVDPWPDLVERGDDIVYVGDVTEARGALFAVEAVAAMRERRRLRLIGRCSDELRGRIVDLAERVGVEVDLPGFLPHEDAMRAIAGAAVGLCPLADIPNYRHSLPTKMLEYLSLGVPVLASDLPGTASVLRGMTGVRLLPPRDHRAWALALDEVVGDADLRAEAGRAAAGVRTGFTWPAEHLLGAYASLVEPAVDGGSRPIQASGRTGGDESEPSA